MLMKDTAETIQRMWHIAGIEANVKEQRIQSGLRYTLCPLNGVISDLVEM